ncbi:MAG: hypothetical protein AB4290_26610 [Spirulina sp.]
MALSYDIAIASGTNLKKQAIALRGKWQCDRLFTLNFELNCDRLYFSFSHCVTLV